MNPFSTVPQLWTVRRVLADCDMLIKKAVPYMSISSSTPSSRIIVLETMPPFWTVRRVRVVPVVKAMLTTVPYMSISLSIPSTIPMKET